jgi:hypothetical protein
MTSRTRFFVVYLNENIKWDANQEKRAPQDFGKCPGRFLINRRYLLYRAPHRPTCFMVRERHRPKSKQPTPS